MTALRGYIPAGGEAGAVGVHSLDHFTLQVPDLAATEDFYSRFGLNVRPDGNNLALRTFGHDQRWGTIVDGKHKRLHPRAAAARSRSNFTWPIDKPCLGTTPSLQHVLILQHTTFVCRVFA
jgi:catechol 2,3-dioxygenase-like lactoylglutathione lyase family enzyme